MHPTYRKDIDGLRAVAVISVILFHSGVTLFSGGYVGVDVFFVISGFLITTIIYREIEANEFSIARFYERRIRRIFPALFAVIVFCLIMGFLFYSPDDFRRIAKTIRYTVIFYSNYFFARKTGYFDSDAELDPLLHMWSLAVEEQYYIVFPAVLFIVSKYLKKKYLLWLSVIFVVSFVASVYGVQSNLNRAFFATGGRAWELILGSFIALNTIPNIKSLLIKNILSLVGLILILSSIFLFNDETVFPGPSALLPCVGAALIIYSGIESSEKLLVGKILSLKPFVFIGIISYSLYMWHWPLIIFSEHLLIRPLLMTETFFLLGLIGVVSYFSWKYIEQPFRSDRFFADQKRLFKVTLSIMFIIFLLCLVIKATDGFAWRSNIATDVEWKKWGECSKQSELNIDASKECRLGKVDNEPSFLLWGDSHARAMAYGVSLSAEKHDSTGLIASANGCPPLIGVHNPDIEECLDFNNRVIDYISKHAEIKMVVLTARWAAELEGGTYGKEASEDIKLIDTLSMVAPERDGNEVVFNKALKRTINRLLQLNRNVVLVSQVPEIGYNVASVYFLTERINRDVNDAIAPSVAAYRQRNKGVEKLFNSLKGLGVTIVEPWKRLCDSEFCKVMEDSQLLYHDDDHMSSFGARLVSPIFDPVFIRHSSAQSK
ncbi:MAG: hypothetical protein COB62_07460 [Piscirickettsiaceae bacterium]|nr:MAG: hypothetical protein COB62_07460 [Piscirickettsiaceae bacterium]